MIDLSDPNTDVVKLYKEFKKWVNGIKRGMRKSKYTTSFFERHSVSGWIYFNKRQQRYGCLTETLLSIWERIGLVGIRDVNTFWFLK